MQTDQFPGFPKEFFTFLQELARNNNRPWFEANKPRYKSQVVQPVIDFIYDFAPELNKISRRFVADPRPHGGSMFRIYKDTRFSKDKRPYKEHVGCHFRHEAGRDAHSLGFYLHLSPEEVFLGVGIWMPPNPVLDKIRQRIVNKPREWENVVKDKAVQSYFKGVKGDGLKRPPRGYDANHDFIEDIKRKSFLLSKSFNMAAARRKAFFGQVVEGYRQAKPFMKFLCQSLELPF